MSKAWPWADMTACGGASLDQQYLRLLGARGEPPAAAPPVQAHVVTHPASAAPGVPAEPKPESK